jgi:translation initiation factor 3 subunit E
MCDHFSLIDFVVFSDKMTEHDLSKTIIPFLDRHLSFPLLTHLAEAQLFPTEEVAQAQYELAKGTNMFDYAVTLFLQIHPDEEVPPGMWL